MKEDLKIQGQLRYYLQWPIILSILLMAANLVVGLFDPKAGIAMAIFTVIYICFAIWLLIYRKKKLLSSLVEFSAEYAQVQKQLLYDMATPYAIAGDDGKLLWTNKEFALIIKDEKTSRKNLTSLFKAVNKEFLENLEENSSVHTSYDGKFYRLDVKQVCLDDWAGLKSGAPDNSNQEVLLAIYLFDETEILSYKTEIDNQKLVAGLVYLDNYDEALESVEEVRRSLLTALIDRKINKYISGMNGIVKKLEKDKYFFVIKQEYTDSIQEDRFALLEEVKTVNIGNEMAVTLSIGIGMNGDNYARNYEYARTAIDMALGRGGDQAVVKDGSKIRYYGGKSQ
ncbi:MAG: DHH family phosphoesterase, partial [Clostridium sp.]